MKAALIVLDAASLEAQWLQSILIDIPFTFKPIPLIPINISKL
jgi:hypothetical protein